jgi:peptidoglycan/xylan/chitin deacetylase (PgdA/CDA1 family)
MLTVRMVGPPENPSSMPVPDGISCVGLLLLLVLIVSTLSVTMGRPAPVGSSEATTTATAPAVTVVRRVVTATPAALLTQALFSPAPATAVPSATASHTPSPTPTPTATATATATATEIPPPTFTNTPQPIWTATSTRPPLLPTPNAHYSYTLRVPTLMYHYISEPPEDADVFRVDLSVHPAMFRAQMEYLVANGYTTIDFYDLSLAITGKQPLPPKPVIITIDDGYRDAYVNAFPVLRDLGLTATLFIVTEFVDRGYEAYLTWEMIHEMAAAGIRMEPHTKTHVDLRERSRDFLIYQILGSQQTLAAHIGYTPRYLAYPGGRYDDEVIQVLQDLHFWGAVSTLGGKWHGYEDRFEWRRLRVRYTTTLAEFADLVR